MLSNVDTQTLIHVGTELVIIGGLSFWFNKKLGDLQTQNLILEKRLKEMESVIEQQQKILESHEMALRKIFGIPNGHPAPEKEEIRGQSSVVAEGSPIRSSPKTNEDIREPEKSKSDFREAKNNESPRREATEREVSKHRAQPPDISGDELAAILKKELEKNGEDVLEVETSVVPQDELADLRNGDLKREKITKKQRPKKKVQNV